MTLVPTSATGRRGGIANRPLPIPTENRTKKEAYDLKLTSQGVYYHHSKHPKKCQMCWKHVSRFRRKCPICERFIAPGCWPKLCWSDKLFDAVTGMLLNHCRNCHAVLGTLKHIRFKLQYMSTEVQNNEQEIQSNAISYTDFPIGVQVNIMMYLFQVKDFLWSPHYNRSIINTKCAGVHHVKINRARFTI